MGGVNSSIVFDFLAHPNIFPLLILLPQYNEIIPVPGTLNSPGTHRLMLYFLGNTAGGVGGLQQHRVVVAAGRRNVRQVHP